MPTRSRRLARLGLAAALCGLLASQAALGDVLRGVLRSADARSRQIVVTDSDQDDNRFTVTATARVVLNGRRASLGDLRPADRVVVTFHEDGRGRALATGITAARGP